MTKADPQAARLRMALDLSPIVEVARSLDLSLQVVYTAPCRCGGVLDIFPWMGRWNCTGCRRRGDAMALVQWVKGVSDEEALRYLEERAGLLEEGKEGA